MLRVRATGFSDEEREWTTTDDNTPPLRITLTPLPLKELVVVTAARTTMRLAETSASVAVVSQNSSNKLRRCGSTTLCDKSRVSNCFVDPEAALRT